MSYECEVQCNSCGERYWHMGMSAPERCSDCNSPDITVKRIEGQAFSPVDRAQQEAGVSKSDDTDVEQRVARILEQSRQTVKDLVKRELETESVTSELLNLRLHA